MSKKETNKLAVVKDEMSTEDKILRDITEKCFTYLAKPPAGITGDDRNAEIRPLAGRLVELGITSHRDAINSLIKVAKLSPSLDEGFGIVRRMLTKLLNAAVRELHFRIAVVEGKQERWWKDQGQGDVTIGEIETYNVIPWENEPYTVSDFYHAVENLNLDIQTYNEAIINLLGWGDGDDTTAWAIPYLYTVVDTDENFALPPQEREYRPVFNLSEAFMELDRAKERKQKARAVTGMAMLDALTA